MKMKKLLATIMMASVLVASAAGCNNAGGTDSRSSGSSSSEISSAVVSLSNTAGSGYSSDNDTKVMEMLEKVTFNGKPIKIPYKASDLGEGFTFREDVSIYGKEDDKSYITEIMSGSSHLCAVSLYQYDENQNIDDFVAYSIGYSNLDDEKYKDIVQIDGIDGNSTMEEVLEVFGQPTATEKGVGDAYFYKIDDDTYISFWGTEDNKMMKITVRNKPKGEL